MHFGTEPILVLILCIHSAGVAVLMALMKQSHSVAQVHYRLRDAKPF